MAAVLVRDALSRKVSVDSSAFAVRDLVAVYSRSTGIPVDNLYVTCNGRLVGDEQDLQNGLVYSLELRLCGGKGGFGSMLRALGAQIEKTTNREACRDLSGRRLRDVNHEKAMADWVKKQAEREAEKEQRRLERLQRKLAEPKHYFTNPEYQQQCLELSERLEDSVLKGMQASSSKMVSPQASNGHKRCNTSELKEAKPEKRKCVWLGVEGPEDSGSSDDGSQSEDAETPSTSEDERECSRSPVQRSERAADSEASQDSGSVADTSDKLEERAADAGRDLLQKTDVEENAADLQAEQQPEYGATIMDAEGTVEKLSTSGLPEEPQNSEPAALDLMMFSSATAMADLGLERLKVELMSRGLKCGGTLQERAARLFSVRGLAREQINPSLFARPSKSAKK
ncbi:replication stress response regulator SDE2 [Rhinatrema bivittatum]|uniref:replication stress response regulator SDE2 n=1 Tax=Rhinatrema bivittatum TaxID=194408 RepID=UPI00112C0524|nr:replication stress response regulator SDE2 [Rhinatrema bivittatum]